MSSVQSIEALFSVAGRTALVTGASSGLGERFCLLLAAHGARVVCCARREDRLIQLVERIKAAGGTATAYSIDVADGKAIPGAFDHAESVFGPVEILVNNAGMVKVAFLQETSDDSWDQHLAVNLTSTFKFSREAARRLIAAGKPGSIINIASGGALLSAPGSTPYTSTKAGVIAFTRAAAVDLAQYNIRSNCIVPGLVVTELLPPEYFQTDHGRAMVANVPLGRPANVEDLDGIVLLLASEASRYMTGAQMVIDGGSTIGQRGRASNK
jgi:NAD(P)-dependent dehydrogenase (short-subunit alcohol dehydrogenase family)